MATVAPATTSIRFPVQPRLVPAVKAARLLHLTLQDFTAALPALRKAGFPAPCSITGHYDLLAIGAWLDRRAGLTTVATPSAADADALIRERLANLG